MCKECKNVVFSSRALRRIFECGLSKHDVIDVIRNSRIITEYPDDEPYLSCLILGLVNDIAIHIVFAVNLEHQTGIVQTTYIPDTSLWEVPADVFENCGEPYLNETTTARVQHFAEQDVQQGAEIEVLKYAA